MKKLFTLVASAMVALSGFAQTAHQEWNASQLPQTVFATPEEAVAAGFYTIWSSGSYLGTPANYSLIDMPADSAGISAKLEFPSYVAVGNGKYSGKDYAYKLIMGMNNSTRDGLDPSNFDLDIEALGYNVLEQSGYLRKTSASDQDATVEIKDAIITLEVGKSAQQGRISFEHNRGGNNYSIYVIDASKKQQVLMSTPRCPDDDVKTHVSSFNVYPGRRYYIVASDKGSVELYKLCYDSFDSDTYEVKVPANCQQSWTAAQLPQTVFATPEEAVAAGFYTIWSSGSYLGTPANYSLIDMPADSAGISAKLEFPSYVAVGNGKYSGKDYAYKLIMGMNNSTRDGLDPSNFDLDIEALGYNVLEQSGYLRKASAADQDATVEVKDAIVTIEVGKSAQQGQIILEHNRGGNNYAFYVVDASKKQQVMMSTPRCPDDNVKSNYSIFNVYPGRRYYVVASDKGSVELYGIYYNNVSAEAYVTNVNGSGDVPPTPPTPIYDTEKWVAAKAYTEITENPETGEKTYTAKADAVEAYATIGAEGQPSVVAIQGKGFAGEHISGPVANFKDAEGLDPSVEGKPARGILEEQVDNTWSGPKAQKLSKTGTIEPIAYMQGKGNPVNLDLVTVEQIMTEGEATGRFRANWEASYYQPDGSTMGPKNGTYVSLTPNTDGIFKVGLWVNKGSRDLYVCDNIDYKAKAYGTDVKVCGYINGTTWKEDETADEELIGYMKFQDEIKTKAQIALDEDPTATPAAGDYFVIGKGNQASWVWLTFEGKTDVTYYIFNKNTQVGLIDVEFTYDTAIESVEAARPVVVSSVIYNLAGQKVGADYKGIVIKNGKKVMMK